MCIFECVTNKIKNEQTQVSMDMSVFCIDYDDSL